VDITLRKLLGVDPSDVVAAEKAVDVKRVVTTLRKQRYGMVQNPSQYLFCHQVRTAATALFELFHPLKRSALQEQGCHTSVLVELGAEGD